MQRACWSICPWKLLLFNTPLSCLTCLSQVRSKLPAPLVNRVVGDGFVRVGKPFYDLSEIEAEPMVEPDGVTDVLR